MPEQDLEQLRARAEKGEPEAMTAYGKLRLDSGKAVGVQEGAGYLARAAARGNAEAIAQMAALTAAGIGAQSNWSAALDLLQRAATLGYAPAQNDLRFLAQAGGDDFARLRAGVDLKFWAKPRTAAAVRQSPRILTLEGFVSPAECARIIARMGARGARADVYNPATGGSLVFEGRSNSKAEYALTDLDLHMLLLYARISGTLGIPSTHFELTNLLHYARGEQYVPHYDYLESSTEALATDLRVRGQRIVTFLVYLNEGYEGGETAFPLLDYAFKGRTGDALMFGNVDASGAPERQTLHAGKPPTSGEKWILSQWVRNRPQGADRID